jgi:crotonobetainyl-CoA:carnitine CoA-transferase CaiB-like acyl-CoA transferase
VVSLAVYVPGPVATARLRDLGAAVVKVEPPDGDPLADVAPAWYAGLVAGTEVRRLDLKMPVPRAALDTLLADADLLVTAPRPAGLARLGLDWPTLHSAYPRLCAVGIVGEAGARASVAGHDLTYQAPFGLLSPPAMPGALVADLAGAERAVSAALALLLARERGHGAGHAEVALADGASSFAEPLRHGITAPGGPLGGGLSTYGVYETADGWVAVAALEPHFARRLAEALDLRTVTGETLGAAFRARDAAAWEAWAAERDLPLVAVRRPAAR